MLPAAVFRPAKPPTYCASSVPDAGPTVMLAKLLMMLPLLEPTKPPMWLAVAGPSRPLTKPAPKTVLCVSEPALLPARPPTSIVPVTFAWPTPSMTRPPMSEAPLPLLPTSPPTCE